MLVVEKQRCYHFSSLFMTRLRDHAKLGPVNRYEVVKTWCHDVRIFIKDFLLIPVNNSASSLVYYLRGSSSTHFQFSEGWKNGK